MAKIELKISGLSHCAMETALVNSGLIVVKKAYMLDGETLESLVGGKVMTMMHIKVGEFHHMRSGLTLRLNPTMVSPNTLAALLSIVSA